MPAPRLIVFLKAPRPGFVKTRLASDLGDALACQAYRELTETVLAKLPPLPHIELRYTPDDALAEIQPWLHENWIAKPQGNGDLGDRMHRAFEANSPAILIGTDCPTIEPTDLEAATAALQSHDLVLGPAADGGYWLIGLRAPCPALFEGIEWSTETVLEATVTKAKAAGLSVHWLRELRDVDSLADWENFQLKYSK